MKKIMFLLAGLLFTFASCSDGGSDSPEPSTPTTPSTPEETATITLDTSSLTFDAAGGEKSVSFTTNKDWTLSVASTTSGSTWCTASATSGIKGDATVKLTAKENADYDDRSVSVTIKAGTASKTFTVTQKSAEGLLVTSTKFEVAQEGGTVEVEVKANIDYQLEVSETAKSWITEAKSRALATKKHSFTIAASEESEKREGEIYIKSGDKLETVKVYQAGGAILMLSKNEYTVSDAGETISVDIKSNIEYGVQMPDVDWITDVASARGMSSHTLQYTVSPNESYDSRSAEIIFYDKNSDLKDTLKVIQAQKDAIILSQKEVNVKSEGETIEVKLSANVDFEVTMPEVDWISQVSSRGLTEHTLYYKVAENTGDDSRSAKIVFVNKESQLSDEITINQEGALKAGYADGIVTVKEAGTMKKLLGSDYLNITSLKVIGPINGTDIYYLRKMFNSGKLTTLDLSEARIVEGGDYYYKWDNYTNEKLYTSDNVIGDYMFAYCNNLQSICLPNTVNLIDVAAFDACSSLTSIIIPDNVTSIGNNAFRNCSSLTSVVTSNNLISIGEYAFQNCSALISATIGNGVTSIGGYAFYGCSSLTSINIPDGITSISEYTFYGCSSLASIVIPDNVTLIERRAFQNCSSLRTIIIPDNVTLVDYDTFNGCTSLNEVTIGKNVTSIGGSAFKGCSSLSKVTIGKNVKTIGRGAFWHAAITECYCYATTPPTITYDPVTSAGTFTGGVKSGAKLYIPAGSEILYETSDWAKCFSGNIIEMEE